MKTFKEKLELRKTENMDNGLSSIENEMILKEAIEEFGQITVTDGYKTLDIYDEVIKAIKNNGIFNINYEREYYQQYDLTKCIKGIDFNYNVEIGNMIEADRGYPYFTKVKTRNNKFSKIFKKFVKEFIKDKESNDKDLQAEKLKFKELKKQELDNFRNNIQIGTVLVYSGNSRDTFRTVTNIHYTKAGKAKAVDMRYTDSVGDWDYYGQYGINLKPGSMRMDPKSLDKNISITKLGSLYDKDMEYSYDSAA